MYEMHIIANSLFSKSYNNYISTLDKLMGIMTTFKSVDMFKLLMVTFVQEKHHVHEEVIKKNISDFSKGLGLKSFLDITQNCFEYGESKMFNVKTLISHSSF